MTKGDAPKGDLGADVSRAAGSRWETTSAALGVEESAADDTGGRGGPFSSDISKLHQQVAVACTEGRESEEPEFLRQLVGRLYGSGIDPAAATEALIKSNCASLAEVVREMVAQGGKPAVGPVVDRALFLAGPGAAGLIESAASDGMRTDLGGVGRGDARGGGASLARAYFPATRGGILEIGAKDASAYSAVASGYGVYTFVLPGGGYATLGEEEGARYRELLRVIETYTLSAEAGSRGPGWDTHAFLLPVASESRGEPLIDQIRPGLAGDMRNAFVEHLRFLGRGDLADQLQTAPGPFLISSLQPRLIPAGTADSAARLLLDLSRLGSEYMYAVVDAYDRPVPDEARGRARGLESIRARLIDLFGEEAGSTGDAKDQLFVLSPSIGKPEVKIADGDA